MADYQGIFSSGGGGVQTIGAGTNILVDNTDPLNPIVSVTGVALASHTHDAAAIITGTIATARLGSGTASSSTYLKGDQTYSSLDASHITVGTVATARLGTGTANSTTFLRGDQTWQTITGGVAGFIGSQNTASPNNTVNASRLLVDAVSTNADAVIQPKGTGAFLAQLPDSTATGGNKRGDQAVDLQMNRNLSTQVASGTYSVVVGGQRNTAASNFAAVVGGSTNNASGSGAFIGAGTSNTITGASNGCIGAGQSNNITGSRSFIGSGQSNSVTNADSAVVSGYQNSISGSYSFIGSGFQNTIGNAGYSGILSGTQHVIDTGANASVIIGGQGARASQSGVACFASYYRSTPGDTQLIDTVYSGSTGTATPTLIGIAGSTGGVLVPANTALSFHIIVSCRQSASNNVGAWIITGLIANISGVPTVYNVTSNLIHKSVGGWDATAVANAATLSLQVTGSAATISWTGAARFSSTTIA